MSINQLFQSRMTSPKKVKMSEEVEVMQVAKLSDKAIIPTKVRLLCKLILISLALFSRVPIIPDVIAAERSLLRSV